MAALSLALLGPFEASLNGRQIASFRTNKDQALLAYLATERSTAHRRENLMTLLWPGMPERSARHNLRQVVYQLRRTIQELPRTDRPASAEPAATVPLLLTNRQTITLHPAADIEIDVSRFESLIERTQSHEHIDLLTCPDCRQELEEAVFLYRGDFLADFFLVDSNAYEDWAQVSRQAYRRKVLDALETLTTIYLRQQNYAKARDYAERQLEINNLRESAYRQLMEIMALSGQREEALAVYEDYRQLLAAEMDMAPTARTTELYEQILAGKLTFEAPLAQGVRGYELKDEIGQGAYGAIHRAIQPAIGREVAVKVIRRKYASDSEFIRRFETEAQIIARLEHPYIVPLYDYWRDPEGAYLVMRYLRGGSLLTSLEQGPWDLESTLQMLDQLASALAAAHRQGIVHRDIKPANILLDEAGNTYLSDFGIAKNLIGDVQMTAAGVIIGTPDYISPEQLRNEPVSAETDIYSLGAVIYETLTGEKPFPDASLTELIQKHLDEPLPLVSASRPDLPPQLDGVIQRATSKRINDRYADALAMAEAFRRAARGVAQERAVVTAVPAGVELINPYKGLRAFQEADADDFFGRDTLIDQLTARLQESRFLVVVGPSGSGKSSVVKAGLIPALRQGAVLGSEKWFVAEMAPGTHPLEELESALWPVAVDPPPDLVEPMRKDERGLLRVIRRILPDDQELELLLIIDQFEEIFTLVDDVKRRNHFIHSLLAAVTAPRSPLRVVVTLRADFYDRPLQIEALGEIVKKNTEIVLPLNSAELTWAIQEPALRLGVGIDEELVTTLVTDVADQPGALPLVQYAMTELFEKRQDHTMTRSVYNEIGGVLGALATRAEMLFEESDPAGRQVVRQLFLRLVTLGEGVEDTRRRVLWSELTALALEADFLLPEEANLGQPPPAVEADDIAAIIEHFGRARLLTFDHDPLTREPTVEVAHEALLREWPRLRDWLEESRDDVRLQRRLSEAAAEWLEAGRDAGFLLRGSRLAQFASWAEGSSVALTGEERDFLADSIATRTERRQQEQHLLAEQRAAGRLRRLSVALVVFIVVAIGAAIIAFNQRAAAEENEERAVVEAEAAATAQSEARAAEAAALEEAERALVAEEAAVAAQAETERQRRLVLAQSLAALGPTILEQSHDNVLATLLALEAANINQEVGGELSWAVELGLRQVLEASFFTTVLGTHDRAVRSVAFSPDGGTLATVGVDGMVRLWDLAAGSATPLVIQGSKIPEGLSGVVVGDRALASPAVYSVAFSPGGRSFATGGADQILHLWVASDPDTSSALFQGHASAINAVAFAPDGRILASGSDDQTIRLWNPADVDDRPTVLEEQDSAIKSLAFSPDGQTLASGSSDGRIFLWDMVAPKPTFTVLEGHQGSVLGLAFSPDGQTLTSSGGDGAIRLWDLSASADSTLLYQGEEVMWSVAIDQEGETLAASGADGLVRIWDLNDLAVPPTMLSGHSEPVYTLAFAPDGNTLASGGRDTTVRLWDLAESVIQPVMLEDDQEAVQSLSFAPDGETLASSDRSLSRTDAGAIRLWNLAEPDAQPTVLRHANETIQRVAFAPDGQRLASAGSAVLLWDLNETSTPPQTLLSSDLFDDNRTRLEFVDVTFAPDGRSLAATGFDVYLWDLTRPDPTLEYLGQPTDKFPDYNSVAFSPDSRLLATNNNFFSTDSIHLWNLAENDREPTVLIDDDEGQLVGFYIQDLAFTPDGETLVWGGDRRPVSLWDLTDPDALPVDLQVGSNVKAVDVSPNGQRLALALEDGTVKVWSLVNLAAPPIILQGHDGWVRAVAYSPDGLTLASGGQDGTIRLWPTLDGLRELGCRQVRRNLTLDEWHLYLGPDEPYRPTCPDLDGPPTSDG